MINHISKHAPIYTIAVVTVLMCWDWVHTMLYSGWLWVLYVMEGISG